MTDPSSPPPPDPMSLPRDELLDLCASTALDRELGALGTVGDTGPDGTTREDPAREDTAQEDTAKEGTIRVEAALRAAASAAGISDAEIAARRDRFAAQRAALARDPGAALARDPGAALARDPGSDLVAPHGADPAGGSELERARRTRAVRAAIATAWGEPTTDARRAEPRADAGRADAATTPRPLPSQGTRGADRLRRIALVAAASVVVAGIGGLALGGLGGGGSDESAVSSADSSGTDPATTDERNDAAPEAEGDALPEAATGVVPDPAGEPWVELGPVVDPGRAIERWRSLEDRPPDGSADPPVPADGRPRDASVEAELADCAFRLRADGVVVVAVADGPTGALLVARDATGTELLVVEGATCMVVATATAD